MSVTTVLLALLALEFKHFLCDFVLQSTFQFRTKAIYGHYGGFIHSGLHALTSLPALIILGAALPALAIIPAAEFVLHYHVDWAKAQIDARAGWSIHDQAYWMIFGLDQFIHQLTYVGIIAYLAGVI